MTTPNTPTPDTTSLTKDIETPPGAPPWRAHPRGLRRAGRPGPGARWRTAAADSYRAGGARDAEGGDGGWRSRPRGHRPCPRAGSTPTRSGGRTGTESGPAWPRPLRDPAPGARRTTPWRASGCPCSGWPGSGGRCPPGRRPGGHGAPALRVRACGDGAVVGVLQDVERDVGGRVTGCQGVGARQGGGGAGLDGAEVQAALPPDPGLTVQRGPRTQRHGRYSKVHPVRRDDPAGAGVQDHGVLGTGQHGAVPVELRLEPPASPVRQHRDRADQGNPDRILHALILCRTKRSRTPAAGCSRLRARRAVSAAPSRAARAGARPWGNRSSGREQTSCRKGGGAGHADRDHCRSINFRQLATAFRWKLPALCLFSLRCCSENQAHPCEKPITFYGLS